MDKDVQFIISTMKMITRDNKGVIIEPLGTEGGILTIRYFEGTNPECSTCVMQPEAFREMVLEFCKVRAPSIIDVKLLPAE